MEPKNSSLKAALKKTAKRVLTEHQQGNLVSLLQLGRHRELREELHRPPGRPGRRSWADLFVLYPHPPAMWGIRPSPWRRRIFWRSIFPGGR